MTLKTLTTLFFILAIVSSVSAQAEKRRAYAILVDNTGSLRTQFKTEIAIAKELTKQIGEGSLISLFAFATDPTNDSKIAKIAVGVQCTPDRDLIAKQLDSLFTVPGQTTLIDAINTAAQRLGSDKPANCGDFSEINLVLITDGEDRASAMKPSDLISSLKAGGVRVYAVGLINELSKEGGFIGSSPERKSKDFLEKIANETGGKVIFPKKKQIVEEIVKQLFENTVKSPK